MAGIGTGRGEHRKENKRLYPISEEVFNRKVSPIIEGDCIWKGSPPKASYYQMFCGILYILITGCPWRDLSEVYACWQVIYERFSQGGEGARGRAGRV
ncbi:MAG: transposase [Treponema sp.]|jgi:transposase|nr:transposase [Treponema sp.]